LAIDVDLLISTYTLLP